jgi:hypothetical protein
MVALSAIVSLVVLSVCSMGSYLLLKDDSKTVGVGPSPSSTTATRNIESQALDRRTMTAADVFPDINIVADPSIPPYKRLGNVESTWNCRVAANGNIGVMLVGLGCTQVIRATFAAPDPGYVVTAGIFNLLDATSATKAHDQLSTMINSTNRLLGYVNSDPQTKVLYTAPTNLAYYADAHFLIYLVVAREDGAGSKPDDQHVQVIVYDLLEHYLRDTVLAKWALAPTPTQPASPKKS